MANLSESFIYNNISSEKFGVLCCSFNSGGLESVQGTGVKTFETSKTNSSYIFDITNRYYKDPYVFTIQLCLKDGGNITTIQEEAISDWLVVEDYQPLQFINKEYNNVVYFCVCTNKKVLNIGRNIGMEFEFTCNAPFGFSNEMCNIIDTSSTSNFILVDNSTIRGDKYPNINIRITSNGIFKMKNNMTGKEVIFYNCTIGEVITMNGRNELTSSTKGTNIFDSSNFNYIWFSFGYKTSENKINNILFNGTATAIVTLSYRFLRNVGA